MLLLGRIEANLSLGLAAKRPDDVSAPSYLGSYISSGRHIDD